MILTIPSFHSSFTTENQGSFKSARAYSVKLAKTICRAFKISDVVWQSRIGLAKRRRRNYNTHHCQIIAVQPCDSGYADGMRYRFSYAGIWFFPVCGVLKTFNTISSVYIDKVGKIKSVKTRLKVLTDAHGIGMLGQIFAL